MALRYQLVIERARGHKHILGRFVSPRVAARSLKFWTAKLRKSKKLRESSGQLYVLGSDGKHYEWWELRGYTGPVARPPQPKPQTEEHGSLQSRPPDWREADLAGLHDGAGILARLAAKQKEQL